jgi:hypothetical protein
MAGAIEHRRGPAVTLTDGAYTLAVRVPTLTGRAREE